MNLENHSVGTDRAHGERAIPVSELTDSHVTEAVDSSPMESVRVKERLDF